MKLGVLPRHGNSWVHYILFYMVGCAISFPLIYYFLSGNLTANFNYGFIAKHCIQGIAVGFIAGISVYLFERNRKSSRQAERQ